MEAIFSECGRFRHILWERWDESKPMLPWCLWNPSQAGRPDQGGTRRPDPTWTKGLGFSKRLGYGGQVFCNPYDFIATKPKDLKKAGYPRSDDADAWILKACAMGDGKVIVGWGALGRGLVRPGEVLALIRGAGYQPMALGFTEDGLPRHPLMLAYDTPLEVMR